MNLDHLDRFTLYLRRDPKHARNPERLEQRLASFATYEEARRLQRRCQGQARQCVIRFEGVTGGGD